MNSSLEGAVPARNRAKFVSNREMPTKLAYDINIMMRHNLENPKPRGFAHMVPHHPVGRTWNFYSGSLLCPCRSSAPKTSVLSFQPNPSISASSISVS